jgi:hypothetical protein
MGFIILMFFWCLVSLKRLLNPCDASVKQLNQATQFGCVAWYRFLKNAKRLCVETANFDKEHKKVQQEKRMEIDVSNLLGELRNYAKGTSRPCHCFPISEENYVVMESNGA